MSTVPATDAWLEAIVFNEAGLVPVVTQDLHTGRLLMLAWADREALRQTLATGQATYFSRSRARLWRKGETSGHVQRVHELRLDCDGDAVLYVVDPAGGIACHTGRASCFYRRLEDGAWRAVDPVLEPPPVPSATGGPQAQ